MRYLTLHLLLLLSGCTASSMSMTEFYSGTTQGHSQVITRIEDQPRYYYIDPGDQQILRFTGPVIELNQDIPPNRQWQFVGIH